METVLAFTSPRLTIGSLSVGFLLLIKTHGRADLLASLPGSPRGVKKKKRKNALQTTTATIGEQTV